MKITGTFTDSFVAGTPASSPRCVPVTVHSPTTVLPSDTVRSTFS